MLGLPLLFLLTSLSEIWASPWYPVMVPIPTGGHRHTTHIVTHPVYHTRLLVLGSDDHHQHDHGYKHSHNHGHDHKHGHHHNQHHPNHRYPDVQGRSKGQRLKSNHRLKTKARHHYHDHGGHDYDEEYPHGDHYSAEEPIRYSVPVSESPWTPLYRVPNHVSSRGPNDVSDHIPKGYLPLKYLGIDGDKVARVVNEAMAEIDRDMANESRPKVPTSIRDLIPSPVKASPAMYRGSVFYDEDDVPDDTRVQTKSRHVASYYVEKDPVRKDSQTLKLNIECQCLSPHAR